MVLVVVVVVAVVYSCLSIYLSICKLELFCETSSVFELDNTKNAAILRDFLNF